MFGKKRILLVSSAFYPEISPRSFRATELAKELSRQGHVVMVISKYRAHDYDELLNEYPFQLKMWKPAAFKPISSMRWLKGTGLDRFLTRILALLFEYPVIEEMFRVKHMLKKEVGYDLLLSFAVPYPVHWGVAWARKKKHQIAQTWIADCGDPYMGDRLDSFRKLFYFSYLEKWFCRKAEFITIPVESAIPAYYKEFHHKIRIIPQGFSFNLNERKNRQPDNNIPHFAYAGGFLAGIRDPRPLLSFLSNLEEPFRFYVYTNQRELLNDYIPLLGDKLIISDFIPRDLLMDKLVEMDFLINFDNGTTLNVPSKLIDYIITNRPVLNIYYDLNKTNVLEFLKGNYSARMDLPGPEHYHIEKVVGQFMELKY
nr:hypothetical protein [uncultured Carboxylicivirga sp.]